MTILPNSLSKKFPSRTTLLAALAFLITVPVAPAVAQLDSISLPDSIWAGDSVVWVRKVPYYCEGPAYDYYANFVYFTQQIGNSTPNWPVWRVRPGSDTGMVWYNTYQNNGLEFDSLGQLIATQNGRLSRLTGPTPVPLAKGSGGFGPPDTATILVSGTNGVTFNQANDLAIHHDGSIFFTAYSNAVFYRSPSGQLFTATNANATISTANGIERLPWEPNALYVNSATNNGNVYRYEIGENGTLSNRTTFITGIASPDGGTYDTAGNRYIASYGGGEIRVYNKVGSYLGRIALRKQSGIYDSVASSGRVGRGGNASNAVFGGQDMKTLYITGDGGLFSIRLKVPGKNKQKVYSSSIRPVRQPSADALRLPDAALGRDLRGRAVDAGTGTGPMLKMVPGTKEE